MNRLFVSTFVVVIASAAYSADTHLDSDWPQWRGPNRDGIVAGAKWPDSFKPDRLKEIWRVPLGPSYSGPIVAKDLVFTTETKNQQSEVVYALDRKDGKERWRREWTGALSVPFFAKSNGDWIRATPAYDGGRLYVAGMRDVLVCLDAKTGAEIWRIDFVETFKTPLPAFGFVCSPLAADDGLYVQAGASVFKLDKKTGAVLWRSLKDEGGMNGSAFSSPILADLSGKKQLLVQSRQKLAGLDPATGAVLWSQVVPSFRGMNILTPTVFGDSVFTSSYQNKSWLYHVKPGDFSVSEQWSNNAAGYMSSPIVFEGHAYLHLGNKRFTCINLKTGARTWTSDRTFGAYCSMVAQGNRILALDQRGTLLLIAANPKKFELLDSQEVSKSETWAHLAVVGDELFVRDLKGLSVFRWSEGPKG
jgi:outer membrane protein assembly factor BamB